MTVARMLLGAVIGVAMILLGLVLEGGHISSVLQVTAFVLVAGATAGVMLMAYPIKTHAASFRAALSTAAVDPKQVAVGEQYLATMGQCFVMTGLVGAVLGLIHVMENLDKPEQIGPGIAVAFTSLLYGFGCRLFWSSALYDAVHERTARQAATEPSEQVARPKRHAA